MTKMQGEHSVSEVKEAGEVIARYLLSLANVAIVAGGLTVEEMKTLRDIEALGRRDGTFDDQGVDEDWVAGYMIARVMNLHVIEKRRGQIIQLVRLRLGATALELEHTIPDELWLMAIDAPDRRAGSEAKSA